MPDITAVDPTQTATPPGVQTMTAAQTGAPVAVTPDSNITVKLPQSGNSSQLMARVNNERSLTQRAGPRGTAFASGAVNNNAANTVSITADGGKRVTTVIDPNKTYIFKDKKTGQIEIMGKGEAGARAAAARGQAISSANKKNKSNWRVYAVDDPNSNPKTWGKAVLYDKHHSNVIGKIADIALPAIGFIAAGPLGAALGSAASGVVQGRSIGNILKGAAISGVTSAISGQLLGGLGSTGATVGKVTSNVATNALKNTLANGALGSLGSSAASSLASNLAGTIVVNGVRQAATSGLSGALSGALSGGLSGAASSALSSGGGSGNSAPTTSYGPDLTVTGAAPTGNIVSPLGALGLGAATAGGLAATAGAGASTTPPTAVEGDPITVTATEPGGALGATELGTGAAAMASVDAMVEQAKAALKQKGFSPSTSQVLTALQLLGAAGGSGGGSGSGAGGGPLNPIFSAALPTPGAMFANRTPRNVNTDWATYATRPEQSFFSNVPVRGYAEGGAIDDLQVTPANDDFRVAPGVSDGRSDDRPIMASNGEYVVDAETVALLGNGSTEAGARKLDEFRVNLRKQKGAALAQGQFSPPARMPEAYMGAM